MVVVKWHHFGTKTYRYFSYLFKSHCCLDPGLTLEGDSGEEVAVWLLTSLCTSAKREVEVAL
jgi:hypothetical protein